MIRIPFRIALIAAGAIGLAGCEGDRGPRGAPGEGCTVTQNEDGSTVISCADDTVTIPAAQDQARLSGTVTNSVTGDPVEGVQVNLDPGVEDLSITTDSQGQYEATLPVGIYDISFESSNFNTVTETVSLIGGAARTIDVQLMPVAAVVLDASADPEQAGPSDTVNVTVSAENLTDVTIESFAWEQVSGPPVSLSDTTGTSIDVTLGTLQSMRDHLFELAQLPDRPEVVGINPFMLERGGIVVLEVTGTGSDGQSYTDQVEIELDDLGLHPSTGLRNVPINQPVMIHAATSMDGTYNWSVAGPDTPAIEGDGQNVVFTPTVETAVYTVTEANTGLEIDIYTGTWQGAITGSNEDGEPVAQGCEACHQPGGIAPPTFEVWRETGHAQIFTELFEESTHYAPSCLACHSVGYNLEAENGGIDDLQAFDDFLDTYTRVVDGEQLFIPDDDNWENLLETHPSVAKQTNVQCENCHGPNNTELHNNTPNVGDPWVLDDARISIDASVCAECHGEPLRHGRYQQWQQSGHADFELAFEEATVESRPPSAFFAGAGFCGRCHAGQGFLEWIDEGTDLPGEVVPNGVALRDGVAAYEAALIEAGLTSAEVQPVTCAVCHNPHRQGTTSGEPNTATVRITDNTPFLPAGFRAFGVGRGALCITCHNTRNGPHNDSNPPEDFSAPHVSAQGDVLMGENAYFVEVGQRSPHSFIPDTCTNCHMQQTPPPAELSFYGEGTNHTFAASPEICEECHGDALDVEVIEGSVEAALRDVELALLDYINALVLPGTYRLTPFDPETGALAESPVALSQDPIGLAVTEFRGQMALRFDLATPVTNPFGGEDLESVFFQLETLENQSGGALVAADSVLTRAVWNFLLVENDGAFNLEEPRFGAHNPGFTFDILDTTFNVLTEALAQ